MTSISPKSLNTRAAIYIAARVLRDFGEMLVTFAYQDTPLVIVNAMLMIAAIFAVRKGIEVIAK